MIAALVTVATLLTHQWGLIAFVERADGKTIPVVADTFPSAMSCNEAKEQMEQYLQSKHYIITLSNGQTEEVKLLVCHTNMTYN